MIKNFDYSKIDNQYFPERVKNCHTGYVYYQNANNYSCKYKNCHHLSDRHLKVLVTIRRQKIRQPMVEEHKQVYSIL